VSIVRIEAISFCQLSKTLSALSDANLSGIRTPADIRSRTQASRTLGSAGKRVTRCGSHCKGDTCTLTPTERENQTPMMLSKQGVRQRQLSEGAGPRAFSSRNVSSSTRFWSLLKPNFSIWVMKWFKPVRCFRLLRGVAAIDSTLAAGCVKSPARLGLRLRRFATVVKEIGIVCHAGRASN